MQRRNENTPIISKSKNSAAKEAFVLRLNGKIVPWVIVIFIVTVIGRALVAEYRLATLEAGSRDRENRIRVLEDRPSMPVSP